MGGRAVVLDDKESINRLIFLSEHSQTLCVATPSPHTGGWAGECSGNEDMLLEATQDGSARFLRDSSRAEMCHIAATFAHRGGERERSSDVLV